MYRYFYSLFNYLINNLNCFRSFNCFYYLFHYIFNWFFNNFNKTTSKKFISLFLFFYF